MSVGKVLILSLLIVAEFGATVPLFVRRNTEICGKISGTVPDRTLAFRSPERANYTTPYWEGCRGIGPVEGKIGRD